ncbi:MAG: N-acetylmuramoyl-L-alanine amidase [Candidatus Babeliales bacterium]
MSQATIKFIVGLVPFLMVASSITAASTTARNAMTKCFHHRGTLSDKVVCYFNEDPICTAHPRLNDKNQAQEKLVRFFIPLTDFATTEVKDHASHVAERNDKGYQMRFEQVDKPMRGIQLEIAYDPSKIEFCYARSDAIHTHKALVFTFHNKSMVHEIQRKSEGISKLAMHKVKQPTVVIDCGHGGSDVGKVGLYNTCEKDINLSVGFQVADGLKKKGYRVLCTRTADTFVALDERTTYANAEQADLFVSIHSNGSSNRSVEGIETYWSPYSLLKQEPKGSDILDPRFKELALQKDAVSKILAQELHRQVLEVAQKKYKVKDRTVKEAVSQVLIGTDMPAALIELGFLSNDTEAKQLANKQYHKQIAQGICTGIEHCLNHLQGA